MNVQANIDVGAVEAERAALQAEWVELLGKLVAFRVRIAAAGLSIPWGGSGPLELGRQAGLDASTSTLVGG